MNCSASSRRTPSRRSGDVLDHLVELVHCISVAASKLDKLPDLLHDRSALGSAGYGGPATAAKVEQPFLLKQSQRPQNRVRVDSEDGGEISGRRDPLAGLRLSLCDGTPNLGCDLKVEVGAIGLVQLD